MTGDAVEPVFRHHPAEAGVVVATPVEPVPGEVEAEQLRRRLEDANAFGHDLLADPVALDHRYLEPPCASLPDPSLRMHALDCYNIVSIHSSRLRPFQARAARS